MTIVRPRTRISLNLCPSPSPSISKLSNKIVDDRGHFSRTAHKICSLGALEGGGKKITGRREKPSMVFLNLRQPQPRLIRSQTNTTGSLHLFTYEHLFSNTRANHSMKRNQILLLLLLQLLSSTERFVEFNLRIGSMFRTCSNIYAATLEFYREKKKRITEVDDVCKRIHIPGFRLPCQ